LAGSARHGGWEEALLFCRSKKYVNIQSGKPWTALDVHRRAGGVELARGDFSLLLSFCGRKRKKKPKAVTQCSG